MLPVTLRHVQGDLRPAAASGQVRVQARARRCRHPRLVRPVAPLPRDRADGARAGPAASADWFTRAETRRAGPRRQAPHRALGGHARGVAARTADAPARKRIDLPQLQGGDPRPFEVVGIPLAEPGYHVVEIESRRLGASLLDKKAPMFVRTGVLVTNLGVHFKHGRENSLVWVTTLDRGKPVEGAEWSVNDCHGKPLWRGRTDAQGLARVAQALDASAARRLPGRRRPVRHAHARPTPRASSTPPSCSALEQGHRALALQPAHRAAAPSPSCACPHGVRPHAAARRRDGVDEALRARRDHRRPRCAEGRRPARRA